MPEYNNTLFDFDSSVIRLFDKNKKGIIILIETFGGARHYWFYVSPDADFLLRFNKLREKNLDKKLKITQKNDKDWGFIDDYPIKIYKK